MYGIIDIGSNAMRLACYKLKARGLESTYHKRCVAGLASYVEQGQLSDDGIEKAIRIIKEFQEKLNEMKLEAIYAIATASFRNVENTQDILQKIKEETNISVEVLSGEEEARCGFLGATFGMDEKEGMVADIGGGSTELVFFKDGRIQKSFSMPVGCLKMYSEHVSDTLPNESEAEVIRAAVRAQLEENDMSRMVSNMIAVGGTSRALCNLYNDVKQIEDDNRQMECDQIAKLVSACMNHQNELQQKILQLEPDRIHTMLPGMLILDEINDFYQCDKLKVSPWGVREGYLLRKLLEKD